MPGLLLDEPEGQQHQHKDGDSDHAVGGKKLAVIGGERAADGPGSLRLQHRIDLNQRADEEDAHNQAQALGDAHNPRGQPTLSFVDQIGQEGMEGRGGGIVGKLHQAERQRQRDNIGGHQHQEKTNDVDQRAHQDVGATPAPAARRAVAEHAKERIADERHQQPWAGDQRQGDGFVVVDEIIEGALVEDMALQIAVRQQRLYLAGQDDDEERGPVEIERQPVEADGDKAPERAPGRASSRFVSAQQVYAAGFAQRLIEGHLCVLLCAGVNNGYQASA